MKIEADKHAEKMRTEAMKRFGETKKRSEAEGGWEKQTKRRRSGNDAVEFLKEKSEKKTEFRAEELGLRLLQISTGATSVDFFFSIKFKFIIQGIISQKNVSKM